MERARLRGGERRQPWLFLSAGDYIQLLPGRRRGSVLVELRPGEGYLLQRIREEYVPVSYAVLPFPSDSVSFMHKAIKVLYLEGRPMCLT